MKAFDSPSGSPGVMWLVSLIMLVLSISCEEKDPEVPSEEKMPACRVMNIVTNDRETRFEYDNNGKLIQVFGPYQNNIRFEYKDNRLTTLSYYFDGEETAFETDHIEYNANGQWKTHRSSTELDSAVYDQLGNRIKIFNFDNGKLNMTYEFEYLNKNLVKRIQTYYRYDGSFDYNRIYSYQYDLNMENKLAYFNAHFPQGYGNSERLGQEPTPSTNVVKTVTIVSNSSSGSSTANFEYEYNNQGFPTKITVSGDDLNGDGEQNSGDVIISNYQYECI